MSTMPGASGPGASGSGASGPIARTILAAALLTMVSAAAEAREFLLTVEGAPLRRFYMSCRMVDDGDVQHVERKALTPQRYAMTTDAVSCAVSMTDARGRLSVRLDADGRTIAQASINALYGRVRVFSAGPWGGAGSRTDARSFPVQP